MHLNKYARDVTSQYGEDGIIEKLISVFQHKISRVCVEFGAWDGKHLSNTWNLIVKEGWQGCYIEGNYNRYKKLSKDFADHNNVTCIHAMVSDASCPERTLCQLLENENFPRHIGLLSIDIDGNDYNVWRDFEGYDVDIVCIEYNPTFPANVDYVDSGGKGFIGSSALALTRLAIEKGYELVACTFSNCIYVKRNLYPELGIKNNDVGTLMPTDGITHVYRNFAGEIVFSNKAIVEPILRTIIYKSPRKLLKFMLRQIKSFRYIGEDYPR